MAKILVIPSWYPPDGGRYFQDHAEGLAERGYDVAILVNRVMGIAQVSPGEIKYQKKFQISQVNGTRVIRSYYRKWPKNEMKDIEDWATSTLELFYKYCQEFGNPDLILAHSAIWAGYAAYMISEESGIPYIIAERRNRFTALTEKARELLKESYGPYLMAAFKGASKIVTISDALRRAILKYARGDCEIHTIPDFVYTQFFTRPGKRERDPFVILSVGDLEHKMGMDLLIEAFDLISEDLPDAELRIIGEGPLSGDLNKMATQTPGGSRVRFLGRLSPGHLREELHGAKVLALAPRYQAFGHIIVEAMSTGLPVMATRAGGPQTIIPEFAGFLAGRESVPSIFVGLKTIHSIYHDFQPEKISRYANKHFSRKAVLRRYVELIQSIIGPQGESGTLEKASMESLFSHKA